MPIYEFECSHCLQQFEEYFKNSDNSGKSYCTRCGNIAFKVPSTFTANIYKQRKFTDGTTTPGFVNTPKQEKDWLKSQGITLDKPTGNEKRQRKEERKAKSKTSMEIAFKDAMNKVEQGYKIEDKKQREIKKASFKS